MIGKRPKILLVDDDETVLRLVSKNKLLADYEIALAASLHQAQTALLNLTPDLFLLDFLLPDGTGADFCREIKGRADFKDTPVIFMTALESTEKLIEAFAAGAVDYVVKPVIIEELAARVRTQVELFYARREIARYAQKMELLAEERARQLVHADRLATLGTLAASVAHEIKNPAAYISGNIQALERFWPLMEPPLREAVMKKAAAGCDKLEFILVEMPHVLAGIKEGVSRICKVTDHLGRFSRRGGEEKEIFVLADAVNDALTLCEKILKRNTQLRLEQDETLKVRGDSQQISQVLVNLIMNAVDAMQGKTGAKLEIKSFAVKQAAHLLLADTGPGIAPENLARIWEPFFTTKPAGKGTGLGLSISRSIIDEHGGTIAARNRESGGTEFEIVLPLL